MGAPSRRLPFTRARSRQPGPTTGRLHSGPDGLPSFSRASRRYLILFGSAPPLAAARTPSTSRAWIENPRSIWSHI